MRSAVNENLIRTASQLSVDYRAVNQGKRTIVNGFYVRVITRRARVVQHNRVVRSAADRTDRQGYEVVLSLPATCVGNL